MYRKLLVGYDGSEGSLDALALSGFLAASGGRLIAAHVYTYMPGYVLDYDEYFEELARRAEQVLANCGSDRHVQFEIVSLFAGSAAKGLHGLAESESADLIVLGSSRHGPVGRVLAGSVGQRLLHGAPCAIAVAPRDYRTATNRAIRRIGIAFNGSPEAEVALSVVGQLALELEAEVEVIGICEPVSPIYFGGMGPPVLAPVEEIMGRQRAWLEQEVARGVEALPPAVKVTGRVLWGKPFEEFRTEATEALDLLVIGSRGYGPLRRVFLGGLAAELMRSAPCPLLVLPRGAKTEPRVEQQKRKTFTLTVRK